MSSNETFEIFGFDHISTIVLILGLSIISPYLLTGYSSKDLRLFSIGLAFIIVSNEFGKPFFIANFNSSFNVRCYITHIYKKKKVINLINFELIN